MKYPIDVGITVWPRSDCPERLDYLDRSIHALTEYLDETDCALRFTVISEAFDVPPENRWKLEALCDEWDLRLIWRREAPNLGRAVRMLVEACNAPYFFYTQDDWLLDVPIHFAQDIPLLDEVDVLRYRWGGSTVEGVRMLDDKFEKISTNSGWFFAHSPYLARREAIMQLFPMSKYEKAVNSRAKQIGLSVAVRRPSIFTHIGEKSVMRNAEGELL